MTIYDTRVPIHETSEGIESMNSLIDQLDNMLNQYNIRHAFSYPLAAEMDSVKEETGKDLLYYLWYEQEQNTELTLLIALFTKVYCKKADSDILTCIVKSMSKAA